MTKKTDLTLLRAILDAGLKRISMYEERCFKSMLGDLERGAMIKLSRAQRQWVESKYNALDLDRAYINRAPPKVKVPQHGPIIQTVWDQPKVLRPPGR